MLSHTLSKFYERDIRQMIEEITLFRTEEDIWKVHGTVRNSAGNLALHLIGGSNHLFGAVLAKTNYVRNRPEEFARKGVPRLELIRGLEDLIPLITNVVSNLDLDADYPIPFDDATRSNGYVVVQLLAHLNYHLGQVNYLRRML